MTLYINYTSIKNKIKFKKELNKNQKIHNTKFFFLNQRKQLQKITKFSKKSCLSYLLKTGKLN